MHDAGRSAATADAFVHGLARDYRAVELTPPDRAMLDYAVRLTDAPHTITADAIAPLRGAGFDDRAIHDICAVTAYFAFVNRMADGLGVELEDRFSTRPR